MKSPIKSVDENQIRTHCRGPQRLNKVAHSVEVPRVGVPRKSCGIECCVESQTRTERGPWRIVKEAGRFRCLGGGQETEGGHSIVLNSAQSSRPQLDSMRRWTSLSNAGSRCTSSTAIQSCVLRCASVCGNKSGSRENRVTGARAVDR